MGKSKLQRNHPNETANILSSTYFWWVIEFLKAGHQNNLEIGDVYKVLPEDSSKQLSEKLSKAWETEVIHHAKNPSLIKSMIKVFGCRFIGLGFIYFFQECLLKTGQAIMLGMLLRDFTNSSSQLNACGLAGIMLLLSGISCLANTPCEFAFSHLGMQMKVACESLLYEKALVLTPDSLRKTNGGQLINILSNDIKRLVNPYTWSQLHSLWVGPIMICVVMIILWNYIGSSTLVGIIILGIFVPSQGIIGYLSGKIRGGCAKKTDARLQLMNEVLTGIKLIKICGWEFIFLRKIEEARKNELKEIKKNMQLTATLIGFNYILTRFIILLTFLVYVWKNGWLNPENVYVTMFLYNTTRQLMTRAFPFSVSMLAEIIVSLRRIQNILLLKQIIPNTAVEKIERIGNNGGNIEFNNLSCSWDESSDEMALTQISFKVKEKQLLSVIGPVGSGKSCLFQAILNELPTKEGTKLIYGRLAYVSQEPWIFNSTLKENITFGQQLNETWYTTVLDACALTEDISKFPYGDSTLVGEKGIALSEGQKSRVNLARAMYANSEIYLLDDPLSAVDAKVGRNLYDKCIRGILRSKCVILVTHHVNYLVDSDEILALKDGRIEARGTYQELTLSHPSIFASLAKTENTTESLVEKGSSPFEFDFTDSTLVKNIDKERSSQNESELIETKSLLTYGTFEDIKTQKKHEETHTKSPVGLGLCWSYLRAGNPLSIVLFLIVFTVLSQILLSFSDYYLYVWTNAEESTSKSPESVRQRSQYEGTYTTLVAFTALVFFMTVFTFMCLFTRSGMALHQSMAKACIRAPMKIYELNPLGRILNRFGRDTGIVDEDIPMKLMQTTLISLQVFGSVILVCVMNPIMAIPSFVLFLLLIVIRKYYLHTSSDIRRLEAIARSPIYSHVSTTIDGLRTIRAFQVESTFRIQFNEAQDVHSSVWFTYLSISSWLTLTFEFLTFIYTAAVVFAFILFDKNGAQAGLALTSVMTLSQLLRIGMQSSTELENDLVAVERIIEYTHLPSEAPLVSKAEHKPEQNWPLKGQIQMEDVSVIYDENSGRYALQNITFVANSMEKVGIVGRTGAGKSTLMATLLRLVEPCQGVIRIDGTNISNLGLHDLRSKIFVIPQNTSFFTGTLRENLDIENKFTDEEIWKALDAVQIKKTLTTTTTTNQNMPEFNQGLNTQVGAGGNRFSVGERQLICFARAILSQNRILIFDEATASVDNSTDAVIQLLIKNHFQNATVLIIAHRLHTVMECDRVCVMDSGTIVELDDPYILLQNPSGYLSQLAKHGGESSAAQLFEMAKHAYDRRRMFKSE